MLNYFSPQDASSILGIKPGRLRYWNRIGLVRPSIRQKGKTHYDFRDLICLKTAQGLTAKGLAATRIKKSIESLKKKFPGVDHYLANKRIYVFGNRAVISHKNHFIDTQSGQLLFNFNVDDLAQEIESRAKDFHCKKTAEDWFREGLKYDSSDKTHQLALHAYRQALKLDSDFVDAYVNIGNIYYDQNKFADARRSYRLAIARDPYHAKAYFNLGNVVDELNCSEEAIQYYQKSLEVDPSFADVHYNLAAAYEKLRLWDKAVKHWKGYLNFDSDSKHAAFARKRIRLLRSGLVFKV
ncbi:tetratricopeptide repeat protein [Acidobacteria bacterium AH-259-G07]|nr:tetratricopeptide repeat protein [Acidobacteria bacterium AH-259-G07]